MSSLEEDSHMKVEIDKTFTDSLSLDEVDLPKIDTSWTYNDFFHKFLLPNRPCLIKGSTLSWSATRLWVADSNPNLPYLQDNYGKATIPVADCGKKFYNAQEKQDMSFSEYINYWIEYKNEGYSPSMPCLYLKDWHFSRCFPNVNYYRVPLYFASDWLNEYYISKPALDDDYRFVYMGPKGSWTPLHEDVFSSYSWSVNICGRKRWLLLPPGLEEKYKDHLGNLPYDITERITYQDNKDKIIDVVQESGEAIFVPSGWYHQVWNLEDTISVNHNWINACNIQVVWNSLKVNLEKVKKEMADCTDMENWEDQCQIVLKASYGIDLAQFYDFLHTIAISRLKMLEKEQDAVLNGDWELGNNHIIFDLKKIAGVLAEYISHPDVQLIQFLEVNLQPKHLLEKIINKVGTTNVES